MNRNHPRVIATISTDTNDTRTTSRPSAPEAATATARRMTALALGTALLSGLFVLSYGYAIHAPRPHRMRIDVVATAPTVASVRAALDSAVPGGFEVRASDDESAARASVADNDAAGALVVPVSGPDEILTAGAGGLQVQQTVTAALTRVAERTGRAVRAVDLVPLPAGDRSGQASFVFEIGLLIPGVIGSVGFYLVGRRERLWVRVAAATGYAVLAAAIGVLMLDVVLGALKGSPWLLLATGTLVAATFVLTAAAIHTLFGLPGTAIAAGILLVIGNALNGSTVPVSMLPEGYRQLAPWLPNSAAIRAFRDDVYFSGHGLRQPLGTLVIWSLVALLIIVSADQLHVRQRRAAPARHQQIHATPVLTHVRAHSRRRAPNVRSIELTR